MTRKAIVVGALVSLSIPHGVVRGADEKEPRNVFVRYLLHMHATPPPGKKRDIPRTEHRAGHPFWVSHLAQPTFTHKFGGYIVGGGAPLEHGDAPCRHEGTWGYDYIGGHFARRVFNGWNHGRHYQGGIGAYSTSQPTYDPVASTVSKLRSIHRRGGEGEGGE